MWLCEGKLKVKISYFRLPSASQKCACLSSLMLSGDVTTRKSGSGYDWLPVLIYSPNSNNLNNFIELFFCKKIPLSRRVEYVMDGSMDHSVSELVSE